MADYSQTDNCCGQLVTGALRFFNAIVMVTGLGIGGYGIYLVVKLGWTVMPLSVAVAGLFLALMNAMMLLFGTRFSFTVNAYIFLVGALTILELVAAGFFLDPKTRPDLLRPFKDDKGLTKFVKSHLEVSGIILAALAGLQLVAIFLAFVRGRQLAGFFNENDPRDKPLLRKSHERSSSRRRHSDDDSDREEADVEAPKTAADRYRDRNKDLYDKYGIKRG